MSEQQTNWYINRDPRNRINYGDPRALYWHQYRTAYEAVRSRLSPGQPRPPDLPVLFLGNNTLNGFNFDIRKKDRAPIMGFNFPGKSVSIGFSNDIHVVSGAILDKDAKRQDHLFIVPRADLFQELGYAVVYLPTPNQPLHCRIVHSMHIQNPSMHLPPFRDRVALAKLFQQHKVA